MPKAHSFSAVLGGRDGGDLPLVEIPFDVRAAFGSARPKVKVTVNRTVLRTTVSVYGGTSYLGFRKDIREAAKMRLGDTIRLKVEADTAPRKVEVPDLLARALARDARARTAFEALSFTHKKEYAEWVSGAKKPETATRRAKETVKMLKAGTKHP